MSILARFTPSSTATTQQYDETITKLKTQGDFPPDGLEFHVAFLVDGQLRVSEIWESMAKFEAFGPRLMPILDEVGITVTPPEICEVHNVITR
jgi:hypothetical protein